VESRVHCYGESPAPFAHVQAEGTFKILREPRYVQGKVKDGYYPYRVIIDFPTDAALSPPSNLKELRDRIDTESKAWLAMLDQLGPKG
jgi:hypothetical protein